MTRTVAAHQPQLAAHAKLATAAKTATTAKAAKVAHAKAARTKPTKIKSAQKAAPQLASAQAVQPAAASAANPQPMTASPGLTDAVYHGDTAYTTANTPVPSPDPNGTLANGTFGGDNAALSRVVNWAATHTPNYTFTNTADTFVYSGDSGALTPSFLGTDAAGDATSDPANVNDTIFDAEGYFQTPTANDAGTYTVTLNGGADDILGVYVGGNGTPGSGTFVAASGWQGATPAIGTFTLAAPANTAQPADIPIEVIYGNGFGGAATGAVTGSNPSTAVQIVDPNGQQVTSFTTAGTNVPAPAAPTLNTPSAGNAQVQLSWAPDVLAQSYSVYRSDAAHTTPTLVQSGITDTSFLDKSVTNGVTYTYYVTATGASGSSAASNTQTASPFLAATLATEGTVEVDVRASEVPAGTTSTINNLGTAGGAFNAVGGAITVGPVTDANNTTYQALQFSGTNAASSSFNAPSDLTGNSPRSIELWVDNPTIDKGEETMVSWARRGGPNGSNESFSYGSSYGVGQWGGAGYDLQWSNTAPGVTGTGAPTANTWHYLAFTYDGANNSVYVDGQLYLQQPVGTGGLQTIAGLPINLAAQNTSTSTGLIADAGSQGSLDIASVRIENGALAAADVTNNFSAGVPGQTSTVAPTTAPTLNTPLSGYNEVDLTWSYDPNASSYNVYRTDPAHTTPVAVATGAQALKFADQTVTNGTTYTYYVTSVNNVGPGPASNSVTATPQAVPPGAPAAPTVTSLGYSPVTATVTFQTVPFATSYVVQRAPESSPGSGTPGSFTTVPGGAAVTGTGSAITFTDTDPALQVGNNYFYQIIASNPAGNGTPSAPTELSLVSGVEDHYYNNRWWKTPQQNTSAFASPSTVPSNDNSGGAFIPISVTPGGSGAAVPGGPVAPDAVNFEPQINKSGDANTPPFTGVNSTGFSNVLTGKVRIDTAGQYSFSVGSDDDAYLYVDGTLVSDDPGGHGVNATPKIVNPITLAPGTYDFQYFHSQGTGGWAFQMNWSALDLTNFNPIPGVSGLVPQSNLVYLSDVPTAATDLNASVGPANGDNNSYPVTVSFTDNSTSEIQYQLQRSTTSSFAPGTYSTVATTGLVDNGAPSTDATNTTTTAATTTATITDTNAPAGQTLYYRLVAVNYDGSSSATVAAPVVTPGIATPPANGVEAHFFNNEWWSSTAQATTAPALTGVDSYSPTVLTADVNTVLPNIDANGTDTGGGPAAGVQGADFSGVLTGEVNVATAGLYTFTSYTDDDGYLYVDDTLVSSDPGGHGVRPAPNVTPINLTAGAHDIEFFQSQGGGGWDFHLHENGPDTGGVDQVVASTSLTPVARPVQAPAGFTAASVPTDPTKATLTWNANNTSAVRYVIQRSATSTFTDATTKTWDVGLGDIKTDKTTGAPTATTLTYTDTGLAGFGSTYYYRIEAQNYDGTSTFATASLTVANQLPIVAPLTATQNTAGQAVVSFPAESYSSVTGYQLQRTDVTAGGSPTTLTTFAPGQSSYTYTDTGLTSGHAYTYQVIAQNTSGSGPATSAAATSNTLLYLTGTQPADHPTTFTGATDLTFNNAAGTFAPKVTAGGQLQLTDPTVGSTANSVYETAPVTLAGPFETSFDFQFTNPAADGFTFVIQGAGANVTGAAGGALGYAGPDANTPGITPSIAVAFNMYNNVTQTALLVNGNGAGQNGSTGYLDMTSLGSNGNAFHQLTNGSTDVFQATLSLDPANDATSGAVLHLAVRDTTTGLGYTHDYVLPANALSGSPLFGANSQDYIGFTAGTGGADSGQFINDWVFNTPAVTTGATVNSVGVTDNPTAATATTGNQRSQVRGLVLTFASPTTLSASQLSLSLLNSGGSGLNDNSAPTPVTGVFGTPTTSDGGTTWVVPFVASTANTSATGSLNDGIYTLNISGVSGVTSLTFHRLFGDTDGNKTVNALDYAKFKQAFGTSTGASGYNADLDFDNNGTINAADYGQFKNRFGKTFSYT